MRAILIDPHLQQVREVDVAEKDGDADLASLREHIGCEWVQTVSLGGGIQLWIDEEGMLKPWEQQRFFRLKENLPLAGRGVMLSSSGSTCVDLHPAITCQNVWSLVSWVDAKNVVVPVMTIARAEFRDGRLMPVEDPVPTNAEGRTTWDFEHQPNRGRV
jgi:hypothetical protein